MLPKLSLVRTQQYTHSNSALSPNKILEYSVITIYYNLYGMQELIIERMMLAWSKYPGQGKRKNFEILPGASLNTIKTLQKHFIQN